MTATMPTDALAEAIGVLVAERLRPEVQALVQSLIIPVKDDVLAGAEQIASHMGVQERFVRDHEDDLPVRRVGSKLFASRSAVTDWLRCRQDALVQSLIIPVKDDVLAGAEQIASHMGVQERFVRDHEDDLPVRRVGSKLFASRSAVTDWLRCRQDDDSQPPRGP